MGPVDNAPWRSRRPTRTERSSSTNMSEYDHDPTQIAPIITKMSSMQRLSIVIPNYNYGKFVGAAVSSALALDWPHIEVIVVDDGSTDDSLEVLRGFGNRIKLISQANAGPREACNRGFAESVGDVVIFLDSDDVLEPSIAVEVAEVWYTGISKVQVQMRRIDRGGSTIGRAFPDYRFTPTSAQIYHWMKTTAAYPTPPGSGNVYSRKFLEMVFPLDDRCGDAADSACVAAAPYLGDVVTIVRPLVGYRVHGGNRSNLLAEPARFTQQILRAYQRHEYAVELSGGAATDFYQVVRPLFRGRHLLQMRIAERRYSSGAPPIPTDGRARMLRDSIANIFAPGPESATHRVAVAAWCIVTLFSPDPVAKRLINWRFR